MKSSDPVYGRFSVSGNGGKGANQTSLWATGTTKAVEVAGRVIVGGDEGVVIRVCVISTVGDEDGEGSVCPF